VCIDIGALILKRELNWQTGIPPKPDLYFVAEVYWYGGGVYGFLEWNGTEWDTVSSSKIVGFISEQDLIKQLKIQWPEEEEEQYEHVEPPPPYPHDEEPFQRVFSEMGGIAVDTLIVSIRAVADKITRLKQQLATTTPADPRLQDELLASMRAAADLKACYERAQADGRPLALYEFLFLDNH
jgi:hypothetical protein